MLRPNSHRMRDVVTVTKDPKTAAPLTVQTAKTQQLWGRCKRNDLLHPVTGGAQQFRDLSTISGTTSSTSTSISCFCFSAR